MQYYVYDAGELLDVIELSGDQLETFKAENPHFRLEECNEDVTYFEDEDEYYN